MVGVVPVAREDYDRLADFLAKWPEETRSPGAWRSRFRLWWDDNPYFGTGSVRGFALEHEKTLVGFFGLVPVPFQVGFEETVVYGSTTWRVDPAHRAMSLAALAKVMKHTEDTLLFVTTGTRPLGEMLKKLRFAPFPRPPIYGQRPRSLFVLRLDEVLSYFRGRSRLLSLGLKLPSAVVGAAGAAEWAWLKVQGTLDTRILTRADAAVDALWSRTKSMFANTNVRSAAFLNWHCFSHAEFSKVLVGAYDRGNLVGLAVVHEKRPRGVKVHEVLDLWWDRSAEKALPSLFARMIQHAYEAGAGAIELPNFTDEIHAFTRRRGFIPRKVDLPGELYLGKKERLEKIHIDDTYLCLMQGDMYL